MAKKIMRVFSINEISAVDSPAQKGARAVIMKRHDKGKDEDRRKTRKGEMADLFTSVENGHQHGISVHKYDDEISVWVDYSQSEGEESHSHSISKTAEGEYVLSMTSGHTHEIDMAELSAVIMDRALNKGDEDMDPEKVNKDGKDDKDPGAEALEALKAKTERMEKILELGAEERSHFDSLDGTEAQDAFLSKSADERTAEIEKVRKAAADADPVVFKAKDGSEYRKSDDPRLVEMAKAQEADREELEKQRTAAKAAEYEKRAKEELQHLPGNLDTRINLLKAVDAIPDEAERAKAMETLKADNEAMAKAFQERGHNYVEPSGDSPEGKLEALAKAKAEKDNISYAKAYTAVISSKDGQALYEQTIQN